MLRVQEMLVKAKQCEDAAYRAHPISPRFFHEAARQWRDMAAQLELLEREQVYRIIRNSSGGRWGTYINPEPA